MNRSDSINELATALAKAQAKLRNPAFDSLNPHFKSKFASLANVRDTVTPVLAEHGLSVTQWPETVDGHVAVTTLLAHASGQWISSTLHIPTAKNDAHGAGSSITYARRYALMACVGVVGDNDDDGNAAVDGKAQENARLRKIADACIAKHARGDGWGCYEEAAQVTDPEERVALWDMLSSHSAVRSAIKEYAQHEKSTAKAAA